MSQLIEIRDMCKVYNPGENEVWALNHVNLSIGENEFVAIIGQSGSGKSTLMNILGVWMCRRQASIYCMVRMFRS